MAAKAEAKIPEALSLKQDKWYRKVKTKKEKWATAVSSSDALDAYVTKIATLTGKKVDDVKKSSPVEEYSKFQANVDVYKGLWEAGVENAYSKGRWAKKYIEAFSPKESPKE